MSVSEWEQSTERTSNERRIEILLDVKLRAASRQSDRQAAYDLQTANQRLEVDPDRRWSVRVERQRRFALLEAEDRQVSRRAMGPRRRGRSSVQVIRLAICKVWPASGGRKPPDFTVKSGGLRSPLALF